MRRAIAISIAITALGTAVPAAAEAWRVAAASHNVAVMLVDTDSVSRNGNTVFATIMTVAPPQRASDWDRSVIRREIDCANGRSPCLNALFSVAVHSSAERSVGNHSIITPQGP